MCGFWDDLPFPGGRECSEAEELRVSCPGAVLWCSAPHIFPLPQQGRGLWSSLPFPDRKSSARRRDEIFQSQQLFETHEPHPPPDSSFQVERWRISQSPWQLCMSPQCDAGQCHGVCCCFSWHLPSFFFFSNGAFVQQAFWLAIVNLIGCADFFFFKLLWHPQHRNDWSWAVYMAENIFKQYIHFKRYRDKHNFCWNFWRVFCAHHPVSRLQSVHGWKRLGTPLLNWLSRSLDWGGRISDITDSHILHLLLQCRIFNPHAILFWLAMI